jgi:hypothetical protein
MAFAKEHSKNGKNLPGDTKRGKKDQMLWELEHRFAQDSDGKWRRMVVHRTRRGF